MPRVNASDMAGIVEVPTGFNWTPLIADANTMVNHFLSGAGYTEAILTLIEKYMAAHLATLYVEKGGLTSVQVGESKDTYAQTSGHGLRSTRFGQMALNLDTAGKLSALGSSSKPALFRVM